MNSYKAQSQIFIHDKKQELHARVIVTNYSFLEDPHETGFDLFDSNKARKNGSLNIKNLYSDLDTMISSNKLTVIQDTRKYIEIFKEYRRRILENEKLPKISNPKPGDVVRNEQMIYITINENPCQEFINRLLL